jgi:hypothetical protein
MLNSRVVIFDLQVVGLITIVIAGEIRSRERQALSLAHRHNQTAVSGGRSSESCFGNLFKASPFRTIAPRANKFEERELLLLTNRKLIKKRGL